MLTGLLVLCLDQPAGRQAGRQVLCLGLLQSCCCMFVAMHRMTTTAINQAAAVMHSVSWTAVSTVTAAHTDVSWLVLVL